MYPNQEQAEITAVSAQHDEKENKRKATSNRSPRQFHVITIPDNAQYYIESPPMDSERECQNWIRVNGKLDTEYFILISMRTLKPIVKKTKTYLS